MPMNVILLERVPKLGQMGDVVKVKPGFARNFLLPQKKALRATKDELADTLEDYEGQMWDQSPIFRKVYTEEYSQFGGAPYGALIGAYEFSNHPRDVGLLRNISGVCASAHTPFIAAASPRLFRMDSWQELPNPQDLAMIVNNPAYASWQSLRESEDARYIGPIEPGDVKTHHGRQAGAVGLGIDVDPQNHVHGQEKARLVEAGQSSAHQRDQALTDRFDHLACDAACFVGRIEQRQAIDPVALFTGLPADRGTEERLGHRLDRDLATSLDGVEAGVLGQMDRFEVAVKHLFEQMLLAIPIAAQRCDAGARLGGNGADRTAIVAVRDELVFGCSNKALPARSIRFLGLFWTPQWG